VRRLVAFFDEQRGKVSLLLSLGNLVLLKGSDLCDEKVC